MPSGLRFIHHILLWYTHAIFSLNLGVICPVTPTDYGAVSAILRFAPCEINRCVNITIVDDSEIESDEAFNITLERTPSLNGAIMLDAVDGMIGVSDDDDGRLDCI